MRVRWELRDLSAVLGSITVGLVLALVLRVATRWVLVSFPGGRPRRVPPEMRADFEVSPDLRR